MIGDLDLAFDEDTVPRSHRRGRRSGRGRRPKRRGRSFLAMVLTLLLFGGLAAGAWYGFGKVQDFFTAPDYDSAGTSEVTVQVRAGDTAAAIAKTLYDAGVVKSTKAFVQAADSDPRSKNIQAGHYKVRKEMRARDALGMLLDPKNRVVSRVTIPEGLTYKETFKKLSESTKIPVEDFEAAAKDPIGLGVPDFWFNRSDGKEAVKSIEGFLYPATYEVEPGATAQSILKKMVAQFLKVAQSIDLVKIAESKDLMPFEALVVASLVEAEAGTAADMPKVSRVVYNRLNKKMNLEFDSTSNYWRELQGVERKHNLNNQELADPNNPYRTYGAAGLPPGPIGSPGKAALAAAVNPEPGNWLYFVLIDKNGNSAFTDSYAQHQANIATAKRNGAY